MATTEQINAATNKRKAAEQRDFEKRTRAICDEVLEGRTRRVFYFDNPSATEGEYQSARAELRQTLIAEDEEDYALIRAGRIKQFRGRGGEIVAQ
jgi:hypothetical protein